MGSSIYLILPAVLGPGVYSASTEILVSTRNRKKKCFWGIGHSWCPIGLKRPVTGIALLLLFCIIIIIIFTTTNATTTRIIIIIIINVMSMTEGENYVTNCENDYKFKRILES
jgi:hypothetical protein